MWVTVFIKLEKFSSIVFLNSFSVHPILWTSIKCTLKSDVTKTTE